MTVIVNTGTRKYYLKLFVVVGDKDPTNHIKGA